MEYKQRRRTVEQWFSPVSAAAACGVDVATIRRRLRNDQIPGARRLGPNHWDPWEIPLSGLVQAGLCAPAYAGPPTAPVEPEPEPGTAASELASARRRIADLEDLVARLEVICDQQRQLIDRFVLNQVA